MLAGERVRQARLAAGLSLRALAERADLSATAISKYETGKMRPGPGALARIADALGLAMEYFSRPVSVALECPAYRSTATMRAKTRAAVENEAKEMLERAFALDSVFGGRRGPQVRLRPMPVARVEDAEKAATRLRRDWNLGTDPIANLTETLEARGVKVILVDEGPGFDGFSCWANGTVPVVISRKSIPGDRQRFNLAHELGHLLLKPHDSVDQEKAAYRFAGAFLIPKEAVLDALGKHRTSISLEELGYLKHTYGASMQAWLHRARQLGVITQALYVRYRRQFNAMRWRTQEPGRQVLPERSSRFPRLLEQALAEKLITPARAAQLSGRIPRPSMPRPSPEQMREAAEAASRLYETDAELTEPTHLNVEDAIDD